MNKNDVQNSLQFRHDGMGSKGLFDLRIQGNSNALIQTPVKTKKKKNKVLIYV